MKSCCQLLQLNVHFVLSSLAHAFNRFLCLTCFTFALKELWTLALQYLFSDQMMPRIRKLSEIYSLHKIFLGHIVALQGRELDYRRCHWKFSLTYPCSRITALGVDSASNKTCRGKAVPLQAWSGPERSRKLTLIVRMWRIGWAHNNARK